MIHNVILDMGNVLLDYDPDFALNAYLESEEDKQLVRKELFEGPEWVEGDLGLIENAERFDGVAKRIPSRLHGALRKCVDNWYKCMVPLPGARQFCKDMKSKGYRIYVLSNACHLFYEYFPAFLPLDFFDGIVVSSDVHIAKPDIRIYEHLLDKYRLNAAECLFVDDRANNVEGARQAGMKAILFENDFEAVEKCIKSIEAGINI